jgi:hypothetical protein
MLQFHDSAAGSQSRDGEIKRAFVQAYFGCFLASLLAVINSHSQNDGTMRSNFFGNVKVILLVVLTIGYGWFAFFQKPKVFDGMIGDDR